ncbi:hypothetical protein EDD17DRAFT_1517186 [Pisolithus thermaeus]|nr:hypothetical protein EDD17DRAFT_1517186 [Pisolithus thermaeus]
MHTMQTMRILHKYTDRGQPHYSDPSNSGTSTTQKNCSLSPIGGRKKDTSGRVWIICWRRDGTSANLREPLLTVMAAHLASARVYTPPPFRLFHAHHSTERATLGGGAQCNVELDFEEEANYHRGFSTSGHPNDTIRISAFASEKTGVRFEVDASKHRDLVIPEEGLTPDRRGSLITVRQLKIIGAVLFRQLASQNLITAVSQSMKWMHGEGYGRW